jgi:anti-anti-sigma regulatory factor
MNAGVIVVVAASVGSGQVVLGTILGVILSAAIFIAQMSRPAIRRVLRVPEALSKRARPRSDMDRLRTLGRAIAIFELEGALFFGNAEDLATGIKSRAQDARFIILDFDDVSDIDISGAAVLSDLVSRARSAGVYILICNVGQRCEAAAIELRARQAKEFSDRDMALEWAEDRLLAGEDDYRAAVEVPLEQHELLAGLSPSEVALVAASLRRLEFRPGQIVCSEGEKADSMWMIVSGSVSIRVRSAQHDEMRRIASRTAGTMVGEMALLEGGRRSATIVADDPVIVYELDRRYFTELLATSPAIANRILHNIAVELAGRLRIAAGALGSLRS